MFYFIIKTHSHLLFIIALYSSKVTFPSSLVSASLIISSISTSGIDTPHFFANALSSSCVTNPSPSLSYLLNISSSSFVKYSSQLVESSSLLDESSSQLKKCNIYLAHVIKTTKIRISNPQYFVYLLDQQYGETLQFIN